MSQNASDFWIADKTIRVLAWWNLVLQTVIIATGGAVRLTGSGMGCSTWPKCSDDAWTATPELGYHSFIEFGNRMMSPVLLLAAALLIWKLWQMRFDRKDLFYGASAIMIGTILQGVVGGLTVIFRVNPWTVGFHYLASAALVALATWLVFRSYAHMPASSRTLALPRWAAVLTHLTAAMLLLTVVIGVLTTGSGPHSGDEGAPRNGFNWDFLAHLHSYPAYALLTLSLLLCGAVFFLKFPKAFQLTTIALLIVIAIQMATGIIQSNTALPPLLVGIHMVLAAVSVSIVVALSYTAKQELVKTD